MDNAAATRLDERVWEAMRPYYLDSYAVATSEFGHSMGLDAREALGNARAGLAAKLGIEEKELVFTSGDTESSNTALKGVARSLESKGKHIVVSAIEDFPVLNSAKALERQGYKVTYLPVDPDGVLALEAIRSALTTEPVLVSVQQAKQEIGTLQDLKAIGEIGHEKKALLHTDATHAFARVPTDYGKLPVDLVTVSAHTIHGPKGVGGLIIKEGTPFSKWMDGGFQEINLRAGRELVTEGENERIRGIRDVLLDRLTKEVEDLPLKGHRTRRVPQNANVTFHYVEGESITLHLDMREIEVSTGSACFSRSLEASHVIMGIGGDHERAHGSIRYSLGRFNSMEETKEVVEAMKDIVNRLREISPLKRGGK